MLHHRSCVHLVSTSLVKEQLGEHQHQCGWRQHEEDSQPEKQDLDGAKIENMSKKDVGARDVW